MRNEELTFDRLRELLYYCHETGTFTWLQTRQRSPEGSLAGHTNKVGYCVIGIDGKYYKAHRLAFLYMTGEWPKKQVDHINRNKSDNRWSNLRDVSNKDNQRNSGPRKTSKTGITGVTLLESNNKYFAYIFENGVRHDLYLGDDLFEACCARKSAESKLFND